MSYEKLRKGKDIVLPKDAGVGIRIDSTVSNPDFGYKDLIGQIVPHAAGGTAPSSTLIRGSGTHVRSFAFSAGDVIDDITFHLPHDYVPNTDIYIHVHWTHAGTVISGNFVLDYYLSYCKGYNQASQVFVAEKNVTQTVPTANVTAFPQYGHFINEFTITASADDSTHFNRSIIEVDGLIKVANIMTTIPTITGSPAGSVNEPFILMIDLHYQSTQLSTKNKNYPFYT